MQSKDAIQSMFADMGLATPDDRSRYRFDFGATNIQSPDDPEPCLLDNRTEKEEGNRNAELG